jgi:hypothetical protein
LWGRRATNLPVDRVRINEESGGRAPASVKLTASAITNGELDGDGHPYVGLMVAHDASAVPLWRCSGPLLPDTVFITAGHCTQAPAAHV